MQKFFFCPLLHDIWKSTALSKCALASSACPSDKSNNKVHVSMEHRWNDTDRGKLECSEKNLSQCNFVHHNAHMDWPGIELGPSRWETHDQPFESWHGPFKGYD
jgi:hypothetical protein